MPITKATGYKAGDGVVYATIEEAQVSEMLAVLKETDGSDGASAAVLDALANDLVYNQSDAVLAILTTGPRSRPGARKKATTSNPRRAAKAGKAATPAQAQEGFKEMHAAVEAA